jgi:alpha-glucosidase (family GH31 glycosyl hydrolase)
VRVYPGADGSFTLFNDDGQSYGYETGHFTTTELRWNDASRELTHHGPVPWNEPDSAVVKVIHP